MINVSHKVLKFISALVWYTGGLVLILKGSSLLLEADYLKPGQTWPTRTALFSGLLIGALKAKFIFCKSCKNNLKRIDSLENPKVWQFFKPWFFVFLLLMIITGAILSRNAHNNYSFLIGVAILDFSIATALLGSSYIFWTSKFLEK